MCLGVRWINQKGNKSNKLSIIYSIISLRKRLWVMNGFQNSLTCLWSRYYVFVPMSLLVIIWLSVQANNSLKVFLLLMETNKRESQILGKFCLAILLISLHDTLFNLKKRRPEKPKQVINGNCIRECLWWYYLVNCKCWRIGAVLNWEIK